MSEPQDKKSAATAIPPNPTDGGKGSQTAIPPGPLPEAPDASSPRKERDVPLDTRLLSEAVIELNISRKNVGIYPPGHIQITKSIDRAYEILQKLFEIRAEMTLGVAKDTLLVGRDYLDQKNPVYRDFALSMSQQEIAAVTFIAGLQREELVRFHRILTTKPEEIRTAGGIDTVVAGNDIPHIRVQAIDYTSFHVTEEQEILSTQGRSGGKGAAGGDGLPSGEGTGTALWRDFVANLAAGTLAGGGGQGISITDAEKVDPAELARLLNERKLDAGAALQSYDSIISSHIRGRAEKRQLTHEQSATLANMSEMLQDLHPELRKQFLSVAFRRISSHTAQTAVADDVLGGFPDDLVIDMLKQASSEGREISPTLTGLLGKLTDAKAKSVSSNGPARSTPPADEPVAALILPEHMEKLFDREKYEEYVSAEYDAMLKDLSRSAFVAGGKIPVDEYVKTFEDNYLDFQIGRALIAFMEENIDEEDYREFAKKVVEIMPGFLVTGNFMILWDISETLRKHTTEKPVKGIRESAAEARKAFLDPAFIAKALSAFEVWMKDKGQEAAGLILSLGSATIPGLLDIYSRDASLGGKRTVLNLLCMFGESAVREAHKRLKDPRPEYVKDLLVLIKRSGTPVSISHVKPLLRHQDQGVRMETLSVLLKFKDAGAVKLLRDAIHSKDPDEAFQAIALAGQYRVTDVIDDILGRVKRIILFETDYGENEEIIKALADIGDSRVIPELERFAKARTLYPQRRARMQRVLYESLGRYPKESVAGLLQIGERSPDEEIRKICRKLLERH